MNRRLKPIFALVGAVLVVGLIVTGVLFFIPRDNTSFSYECFRLRWAVSDFLKDVEKQRLDDAFDRVFLYSEAGAVEKTDALRTAWTDRISDLKKNDNTYLNGFSRLKVAKKNGEFTVTVTLSVTRQGYNDPFYANGSEILVTEQDGAWYIREITGEDLALQTSLEKALSGRISGE